MADKSTIARPYAKAAFEAAGTARLGPWAQALRAAAGVVTDPRVGRLLGNPRVLPGQLADLVIDVAGGGLDEHGRNFIRLLADNRRLDCLPAIAKRFEQLKAEAEGTIDVAVTSAVPLSAAQRGELCAALERRLKRTVRLQCATDPQLIGGAVLRAGDLVIDGSLLARLHRIAYELTA
jgi:F-type H+-transporting ATPase subunit delta